LSVLVEGRFPEQKQLEQLRSYLEKQVKTGIAEGREDDMQDLVDMWTNVSKIPTREEFKEWVESGT